jgi:predicted HTH domain antitoxin
MKRTNIMLTDEQHSFLTKIARKEGSTLGEKIREAINRVYNMGDYLQRKKEVAIEAYQEGFIGIGKLSEVLGLDPVSTRNYLKRKSIKLQVQDKKELLQDIVNA